MSPRVKRRISEWSSDNHPVCLNTIPDDMLIRIFSILDYRSRASLAATCQSVRRLGSSPCLWGSLDLRFHKLDSTVAKSISKNLWKLQFRGVESADAIIHLQAADTLGEVSGDFCQGITDATVSGIGCSRASNSGPSHVSSEGIEAIAQSCPNLRKLHLSGVREVTADALDSLASHCVKLEDVALMDSNAIDVVALGKVASLRFLSVAGTKDLNWGLALEHWSRLPKLVGLDVSRTSLVLEPTVFSSSDKLKILIALDCPSLEDELALVDCSLKGKMLVVTVCQNQSSTTNSGVKYYLEKMKRNKEEERTSGVVGWTERVLSQSLVRMAENNPPKLDPFWDKVGASLLLDLLQSAEVDVRERAATAIATLVMVDDEPAPATQKDYAQWRGTDAVQLCNTQSASRTSN